MANVSMRVQKLFIRKYKIFCIMSILYCTITYLAIEGPTKEIKMMLQYIKEHGKNLVLETLSCYTLKKNYESCKWQENDNPQSWFIVEIKLTLIQMFYVMFVHNPFKGSSSKHQGVISQYWKKKSNSRQLSSSTHKIAYHKLNI